VLRFETDNVLLTDEDCRAPSVLQPGHYLTLTVRDTGTGMDPGTQERIFEPFYTTKELGRGTGLGLATVFGIVRQSAGDIIVHSRAGDGSTLKVLLPHVRSGQLAADLSAQPGLPHGLKGTETILVAEDDPLVRSVLRDLLQRAGYTVLCVSGPAEALAQSSEHLGPIDLLVTDIIMPESSGLALAEQLLIQRSKMKVLYMSGYSEAIVAARGSMGPGSGFLSKPFTFKDLVSKIRSLLEVRATRE
jgi:CheY-like chemotaxis protein